MNGISPCAAGNKREIARDEEAVKHDAMQFEGAVFRNQAVELDGARFDNCTFDNVVLVYGGGPLHLAGCTFTGGIAWRFVGDLGRGLAAIGQLYADKQAVGLKAVVDAMFPAKATAPPTPIEMAPN